MAMHSNARTTFVDISTLVNLQPLLMRASSKTTMLLVLRNNKVKNLLQQVTESGIHVQLRIFLAFVRPETWIHVVYLPMDSQVYFVSYNRGSFAVQEVFFVSKFHPPIVRQVATDWKEITSARKIWERRSDMQGISLRGGTIQDSPHTILLPGKPLEVAGFASDVWKQLESTLNFKTDLRVPGDNMEYGRWDEVISMLQSKDIDVAVASLIVSAKRSRKVDFSTTILRNRAHAYFRQPEVETRMILSNTRYFLAVFWGTVSLGSALLWLALCLLPTTRRGCFHVIFNTIYAFCQQGANDHHLTESNSGRTVLSVVEVAGYLIFNVYSATLVSRLATDKNLNYEYLVDLVKYASYSVGCYRGSVIAEVLQTQLTALNVFGYQLDDNLTLAIEKVCKRDYIFVTDGDLENYPGESCQHTAISLPAHTSAIAFATRKDLPYLGAFSHQLVKMRESGRLARLQKKWFPPREQTTPQPERMTMRHALPCLAVVAAGVVTSAACLLGERLFARRRPAAPAR